MSESEPKDMVPSPGDINAVVGGLLSDLAWVQPSRQQMFGYKRAARAILNLEVSLATLCDAAEPPKIHGVGPASLRVIREVLTTGESPTVERAIDESGQRRDIERRRALRQQFLSRAKVLEVLASRGLRVQRSVITAVTCRCIQSGATANRRLPSWPPPAGVAGTALPPSPTIPTG